MSSSSGTIIVKKQRTRLGSFSLGKLTGDIKEEFKDYTSQGITIPLLETYYNDAVNLWFISKLTGATEYKEPAILPIIRSVNSNGAPGGLYTNATHILTLPIDNGSLISWINCIEFDEKWIGTVLSLTDTNSGLTYKATMLNFLGNSNGISSFELKSSQNIPNIAEANLAVSGNTAGTMEDDDLDLTEYDSYRRIWTIEKIVSSTAGLSVGPPKVDSESFEGISENIGKTYTVNGVTKYMSNFASQIIHLREGEIMHFARGGKLTSYGVRTFHFVLFPLPMVNEDDLIDVLDIYKPDIDKIVRIRVNSSLPKDKIKIQISQDDINWYNDLKAAAQTKQLEAQQKN